MYVGVGLRKGSVFSSGLFGVILDRDVREMSRRVTGRDIALANMEGSVHGKQTKSCLLMRWYSSLGRCEEGEK